MKKNIVTFLFIGWSTLAFAGVEPSDMVRGVDLSARTSVSGALLNQLVDLSTPNTNKGLIIKQSATPDTVNNPRYTNFLWLDTAGMLLKAWNGSGWVGTLSGSNSIGTDSIINGAVTGPKIAAGAIQASNIASGTITGDRIGTDAIKLENLDISSVGARQLRAGAVSSAALTNSAVLETNIADLNVTSNKLALANVYGKHLAAGTVTGDKLAPASVTTTNIVDNSVTPSKLDKTKFFHAFVNADGTTSAITDGISISRSVSGNYRVMFDTARNGTNYIVLTQPWGAYTNSATTLLIRRLDIGEFTVNGIVSGVGTNSNMGFILYIMDPQ
jgi:hypothetical protein